MPRLTDLMAELRSLRIDLFHKILLVIVVVLASLFWLTPYSYHTGYGGALVRINRLSGKAHVLYSQEWLPVAQEAWPNLNPLAKLREWLGLEETAEEKARTAEKARAEIEKFFQPRFRVEQEPPAQ